MANGLPLWNGSQLAIDTTLVSPLTSDGRPRRHSNSFAGRQTSKRTHAPGVAGSREMSLIVVLATEVGGRWSEEAATFLRQLARAKARTVTPTLRQSTTTALIARSSALLAHAAQEAFATSLLFLPPAGLSNLDGDPPPLGEFGQHPGTGTTPRGSFAEYEKRGLKLKNNIRFAVLMRCIGRQLKTWLQLNVAEPQDYWKLRGAIIQDDNATMKWTNAECHDAWNCF